MKCPYCQTEVELVESESEPWLVVSEVVANEFQGYTLQCEENVRAMACPNPECGKTFMIKE